MALSKRPARTDWGAVALNAGLAATIAAGGALLTNRLQADSDVGSRRCELAKDFLLAEHPTSYMPIAVRTVITRQAALTLARCLRSGSNV